MPDETTTDELIRYSHILGLSCMAYLILSGASTFVPAVTMEASTSLRHVSRGFKLAKRRRAVA